MLTLLPKLQSYGVVILLCVLSAFLYGQKKYTEGFSSGKESVKVEYELRQELQDEQRRIALEATAKELSKIEVKNVTIQQKAIKEISTNTVYSECIIKPDGMSILREATNPR